jgi:transposase
VRSVTKEFAASTGGRLRLVFLPGYSPELNPDEWVWKNVKHDRIGKTGGPRQAASSGRSR